MAAIEIVVRIDEPGVPEETLRTYIAEMRASERMGRACDLEDSSHCLPATIVGVVEEKFSALVPYITGEAE